MQNNRPPVDYIERTREQYASLGYPPYAWVRHEDTPPFAPLRKPLGESRIGLIGSGGIYMQGQVAFHYRDDISFRIIPGKVPVAKLRATHFAYDLTDARKDPNVVFPLATLRDLARLSRIGVAPALADRVQKDEVDVVILVPV
jgi:D-proline reductase (dithiol) PrdB